MKTFFILVAIMGWAVAIAIEAGPITAATFMVLSLGFYFVADDFYMMKRTNEKMESLRDKAFFKSDL